MTTLTAYIESIGFWTNGLPSWDAARAFVATGTLPEAAPAKPSPQLLPPNERRRAPESVAVALDVALSACQAAGRDPASLPSVFTSTHGDLSITDYVCTTLAAEPLAMSPTKFHNSVHNAAAGYWTIGAGCYEAATAISAYDGSFAEGLVEALAQLAAGAEAVLLVGYDTGATGPLRSVHDCTGLLGGALLLTREGTGPRLSVTYADGDAGALPGGDGPLGRHAGGNAIAPMLPLFDALATGTGHVVLRAGPPGRVLAVDISHAEGSHD
ncbi:MAG: beta-ketoacyl synthase chain length factor [Xanthomonadaceae bacterium]|nr:beta-ketoacyl synthase chain length factor [Xanthomonadaceae bacterium]